MFMPNWEPLDPASVEGEVPDLEFLVRCLPAGVGVLAPVARVDDVVAEIQAILGWPATKEQIKEAMKLMPKQQHIAVFDTGFHQKMPPQAYLYGIPYELYEKDRIRKYGFHVYTIIPGLYATIFANQGDLASPDVVSFTCSA